MRAERIRSALGAPLTVNDELIGALEVWRRRRSTFTEADVRRILALASLTAIAIHNAELYEPKCWISVTAPLSAWPACSPPCRAASE